MKTVSCVGTFECLKEKFEIKNCVLVEETIYLSQNRDMIFTLFGKTINCCVTERETVLY